MPEDRSDFDKFLKGAGMDRPPAPAAPPPVAEGGTANAAPGMLSKAADVAKTVGSFPPVVGAARELANLGIGATKVLPGGALAAVAPEGTREWIGEQVEENVPGARQFREFAEDEPQHWSEYIGSALADLGLGWLIPELGLEGLAARAVPATKAATRIVPGAPVWVNPLGAGGRFMQTAPKAVTSYARNPTLERYARWAGRSADRAVQGGAAGAAADPNDPKTGAAAGAATSAVLGPAAGRLARSRAGQYAGGLLARQVPGAVLGAAISPHGAGYGAVEGAMTSWPVMHMLRGYHSPIGHSVDRFGRAVFDKAGRFLGYAPVTQGIEAGRVAGHATGAANAKPLAYRQNAPPLQPYPWDKEDFDPYAQPEERTSQ